MSGWRLELGFAFGALGLGAETSSPGRAIYVRPHATPMKEPVSIRLVLVATKNVGGRDAIFESSAVKMVVG